MAPAGGLFRAIDRAFDQAEELTWGDPGFLVADPAVVVQLSRLHRLRSRGVRIGTAEQAAWARSFRGVLIACCPGPSMLTAAGALRPSPWPARRTSSRTVQRWPSPSPVIAEHRGRCGRPVPQALGARLPTVADGPGTPPGAHHGPVRGAGSRRTRP